MLRRYAVLTARKRTNYLRKLAEIHEHYGLQGLKLLFQSWFATCVHRVSFDRAASGWQLTSAGSMFLPGRPALCARPVSISDFCRLDLPASAATSVRPNRTPSSFSQPIFIDDDSPRPSLSSSAPQRHQSQTKRAGESLAAAHPPLNEARRFILILSYHRLIVPSAKRRWPKLGTG
jgi:hypothetical protein